MIFIPPSRKITALLYLSLALYESFQKLELKICEFNKSVNYEVAVLNKKMDSFPEYFNKIVSSSLPSHQEKSLEENISLLTKHVRTKDEIIKQLVETQSTVNISKS